MKFFFVFTLCVVSVFAGPFPDSQHTSHFSARLHYFVVDDENSEAVKLLKEGANTIIKFLSKHTPLRVDGADGEIQTQTKDETHSTETTTESLMKRINIDAENINGFTQLQLAVMHGEYEIVNTFLELGAKRNIQHRLSGKTALMSAVESGSEEIVNLLIKYNADVNIVDKNGDSPLDMALKHGYRRIAAKLVENEASLEQYKGFPKSTVLGCVAINANSKFSNTLTKHGIHVENDWKNGLKDAVKQGDAKTTEQLINNCPMVLREIQEPWPLHLAANGGFMDVIEVLLKNGADINAEDSYGNTPLHWAAFSGRERVAKLLLNRGSNINAKNKNGYTALHTSSHQGMAKFVETLLENEAKINAKSNKGNTPCHWASYFNHADVVKILIEHNADVTIRNNAGTSAREFAETRGNTSIVQMLKDAEKQQQH